MTKNLKKRSNIELGQFFLQHITSPTGIAIWLEVIQQHTTQFIENQELRGILIRIYCIHDLTLSIEIFVCIVFLYPILLSTFQIAWALHKCFLRSKHSRWYEKNGKQCIQECNSINTFLSIFCIAPTCKIFLHLEYKSLDVLDRSTLIG